MQKLPDGIADFPHLIQNNFLYADKTEFLYRLVTVEKPYFLSRPRRFGKSLLVSTLKSILKGRRELFKGLWIDESDYDWIPKPVIHLSLSSVTTSSIGELKSDLIQRVYTVSDAEKLVLTGNTPSSVFLSLFNKLNHKYDLPVTVLIDEYDAPILNEINDLELADQIRKTLKTFYSVLKDTEGIRGFTFITGVTKFTQTSIFSGLNYLDDIGLSPEFAAICGFTLEEFDNLFSEHLAVMLDLFKADGDFPPESTISDLKDLILQWYDGYTWDGKTKILNPWSILKALSNADIVDYWAQTGGKPTFLVKLAKDNKVHFNELIKPEPITKALNVIELGADLQLIPLMFQAGYLTVEKVTRVKGGLQYYLHFPNLEVKAVIVPLLLSLSPIKSPLDAKIQCENMLSSLIKLDSTGVQESFSSYLSNYAYSSHVASEAYYHSLFQSAMLLAGQPIKTEVSVGDGRTDLKYKAPDGTHFVIEIKYCSFKVPNTKDPSKEEELSAEEKTVALATKALEAMKQIEKRKYTNSYKGVGALIYKVALVVGGRTDVHVVIEKKDHKFLPEIK
jgi:hypothetical protein